MSSILEIKPGIGLSNLMFGSSMKQASICFGEPEDVEIMDAIDDTQSTVWHFWEKGFSLFFEDEKNHEFCCVEVDNKSSILFGTEIFKLSEKEIVNLLKSKSYTELDSEVHDWGEKRVSFDDANIDFYFNKNKLVSINFGKPPISSKILILPN